MKYFYLFLLLIIIEPCFSQVKKAYVLKNGSYSPNPKNADSYILIKKLDEDSAFMVNQYTMHDTIMSTGFYKDESLTILDGKFTYYKKKTISKNKSKAFMDTIVSEQIDGKVDTNNYVSMVAYYNNGKRTGTWIEYITRGVKSAEYTFSDDKLNGVYKTYDNIFSKGWSEYNMLNDSIDGKYKVYTMDSLLVSETNYSHNKIIDQTVHLKVAKENIYFIGYLEKMLKKYYVELIDHPPIVEYIVDKTGKVINPKIILGINSEINNSILLALINAPKYSVALYDNSPVEQKFWRPLYLYDALKVHYAELQHKKAN